MVQDFSHQQYQIFVSFPDVIFHHGLTTSVTVFSPKRLGMNVGGRQIGAIASLSTTLEPKRRLETLSPAISVWESAENIGLKIVKTKIILYNNKTTLGIV